ncbi:hypothetical protein HY490_05420 [Candidatus Woesearchaeota archaeon]|nr:hypothetical protein [Candidatus Woesearchaeota archaeon]
MPNLVELPPPVYGWVDSVSVWLLSLALGIGVFLGIGIYRLKRFRILAQVTGSVTSVANALLLVGLVSQEFLSGILGGENTDTIIIVGFSLFIVALVLKIVLLYRAIPGSAGKR